MEIERILSISLAVDLTLGSALNLMSCFYFAVLVCEKLSQISRNKTKVNTVRAKNLLPTVDNSKTKYQ